MKVVLLEKQRMGNLGDQVEVKPGYARNFLFPQGKAVPANQANIEKFEARRAELEAKQVEQLSQAQQRAELYQEKVITISVNASDDGKMFGSIGTRDIAQALTDAGLATEKKEVLLPQGTLRYVGEYPLQVQLHADVLATVTVQIVAEA